MKATDNIHVRESLGSVAMEVVGPENERIFLDLTPSEARELASRLQDAAADAAVFGSYLSTDDE
tara:strand:+ start:1305 stop:1496 length:192 start_codon:yes stop_codon:yes gene_type:complete